jgi:hypothetical protein
MNERYVMKFITYGVHMIQKHHILLQVDNHDVPLNQEKIMCMKMNCHHKCNLCVLGPYQEK